MYDTLKLVLTNEFNPSFNFLENLPSTIDIYFHGIEYGTPVVKAKIRNLKVNIKTSRVVIEGSFHVFCKGENITPMHFDEFRMSVAELESLTAYPVRLARVSRLDFSGNFLVKHPVALYFNFFCQKSRFQKIVLDGGIRYSSEEKELIFYDKLKEMKKKRTPIPQYFQNKNVLRFEVRYCRKLGKHFERRELFLADLLEKSFINTLCKVWRTEYKSVVMEMKAPTGLTPTGSKANLLEQLALIQIHQIGLDNLINEISAWQSAGQITKEEAYKMRKFIKTNSSEPYPNAENELIRELNLKIKTAAKYEV